MKGSRGEKKEECKNIRKKEKNKRGMKEQNEKVRKGVKSQQINKRLYTLYFWVTIQF